MPPRRTAGHRGAREGQAQRRHYGSLQAIPGEAFVGLNDHAVLEAGSSVQRAAPGGTLTPATLYGLKPRCHSCHAGYKLWNISAHAFRRAAAALAKSSHPFKPDPRRPLLTHFD